MTTTKLKLRVWKDETIPSHNHPWMITCPMTDCASPQDGINHSCGWADQATAMRVADRHLRMHQEDFMEFADYFKDDSSIDYLRSIWERAVKIVNLAYGKGER